MRVGNVDVGLSLDDRSLNAELAAAEARMKAALERIDRQKAEVEIKADISQLKRNLKEADAELKAWEAKQAAAQTRSQARYRTTQVERARIARDTARQEIASAEQVLTAHKNETAELRRSESALKAVEGYQRKVAAAARRTAIDTEKAARAEAKLRKETEDNVTSFGKWARSLSQMTVRIGPFTTQIAQLGRALLLLGPILIGVVGTLAALTAALGAGVVGALGLASAGAAGFGLALGGILTVMKPVMTEFKTLNQLASAHAKAVLKYGDNSKQAATAQKQFNEALKQVSPTARTAFKDLDQIKIGWAKLTEPARHALTDVMGQGLKTVKDLMPQFAKETNKTAQTLDRFATSAGKALRSKGGRSTLDDIQKGFNAALPHILSGISSLVAAFGHLAAAFSGGPLNSVSLAFANWAKGIDALTRHQGKMADFAHTTTQAFMGIIHLGGAAGRVLGSFFGAGVGSGMSTIDNMTRGLDRLATRMNTPMGQEKLHKFFSDSAQMATQLWQALRPALQLFIEFATIMRPFSTVGLQVAKAILSISHAILQLAPVRHILQGLFAGFIVAGLVVKVVGLGKGLFGLAAGIRAATIAAAGATGFGRITAALGAFRAAELGAAGGATALNGALLSILGPAAAALAAIVALQKAGQALDTALGGGLAKIQKTLGTGGPLGPLKKAAQAIQGKGGNMFSTGVSGGQNVPNFSGNPRIQTAATQTFNSLGGYARAGAKVNPQIVKIIADSSSAEQAIRRLNQYRIAPKTFQIVAETAATLAKFAQIHGISLPKKTVQIAESGSSVALARMGRIIATKLGDKTTHISAQDSASQVISSILGMLAAIPSSKTTTIRTVRVDAGGTKGRHLPGNAAGGMVDAAAKAMMVPTLSAANGAKVARPTFLTGEENRPEYVIATNPAYRRSNRQYLTEAAAALGMIVVPAAAGYRPTRRIRLGGIPVTELNDDYQRAQNEWQHENAKDKKHKSQSRLNSLRVKMDHALADLHAAEGFVRGLDLLNTKVSTEATLMDNAQKENKPSEFNKQKGLRAANLRTALSKLLRAQKLIKGRPTYAAEIAKQIADIQGTQIDNNAATFDTSLSLDDFIKSLGQGGALNALLFNLAASGTTAGPDDDVAANAALAAFFQNTIIPAAMKTGNVPLETEAYNALANYLPSAVGPQGPSPDDQAIAAQLKSLGMLSYNSGAITAAYNQAIQGSDVASGAPIVYQTVNALHPADSSVFRAIGDAAVKGFGYQGYRPNPRFRSGY